jgi:acetyl-CoA C-acetyltransferase
MSSSGAAYIAGAFEHPTREAPDKSTTQLHAEVARGALDDAGLAKEDVDGYATAGVPEYEKAYTSLVMPDYLNLDVNYIDTTDTGGSAYNSQVGRAVDAIQSGRCDVILITLGGRPRSREQDTGTSARDIKTYQDSFQLVYGANVLSRYAMSAKRHMHKYGTTAEQLGEIRAAASYHAQYNENALYQDPVTPEEVANSRLVCDPLRLLDCCVITDGGGALVVVSESVRQELDRECVEIAGLGDSISHTNGGRPVPTRTPAVESGNRAFEEAGVEREDIDHVSIYDSFTITVLMVLEDLGFCEKGEGGAFVECGTLKSPDGALPFNTDGGGLSSNHPANRGGITKVIESVRQLRGEANEEVQVPNPEYSLAFGSGGWPSTYSHATTTILRRTGQ